MALSIVSLDRTQYQADEVSPCSTNQIQFETTYVAPASIVPTDHQQYATCKGLTYVRPLQRMDDETMLVSAAQLDYCLGVPGKFCTLILIEVQLAQALPYDRTLRSMPEETNVGRSSSIRFGLVYRLHLRREPALPKKLEDEHESLTAFQSRGAEDCNKRDAKDERR